MIFLSLIVTVLIIVFVEGNTVKKSYTCLDDGRCRLNDALSAGSVPGQQNLSQEVCLMGCGMGHLWPYPSGDAHFPEPASLPSAIAYLSTFDVNVSFDKLPVDKNADSSISKLLKTMEQNFMTEITRLDKRTAAKNYSGSLIIDVSISDLKTVHADTSNDESYSMVIDPIAVKSGKGDVYIHITAATAFGYRHALETLSQLITFDSVSAAYAIVTNVQILNDKPSFPYRGIMIDVSRHFISLEKVKENIRAAAYNKLNTVHLHLSDTASIPLTFPRQPNMTYYGAYSSESVFTVEDVNALVDFANGYGVALLPEIDGPAHMGAGWQWGSKAAGFADDLVICYDANAQGGITTWSSRALEPPGGQLNIANPAAFNVLRDIYHDVLDQFHYPSIFHLGGDEVIVGSDTASKRCYNDSTQAQGILQYLEAQGYSRQDPQSFYALWGNFTLQATQMVQDLYKEHDQQQQQNGQGANRKMHIWGGGGEDAKGSVYNMFSLSNVQSYLPPSLFTVQVWDTSDDSIVPSLIQQGYDVILSHTDYVYLDCGNSGFVNAGGYWCQPYHEWYHLYNYIYDTYQLYVLGQQKGATSTKAKKVSSGLLTPEQFYAGVKGSETLIWTEMVDDMSVSQKLWPRSAALAEALWTNPHGNQNYRRRLQGLSGAKPLTATDDTLWYEAADRMLHWRHRLVQRGVAAEALQPTWCRQRESGYCSRPSGTPQ